MGSYLSSKITMIERKITGPKINNPVLFEPLKVDYTKYVEKNKKKNKIDKYS